MFIFIFAILLLTAVSSGLYSQRCGDAVFFNIIDKEGKQLKVVDLTITGNIYDEYHHSNEYTADPNSTVKYVTDASGKNDTMYISPIANEIRVLEDGTIYFRTYCGLRLMEVNFKNNTSGETMSLHIYNIPGDVLFKMDKLPFTNGTYEFNINNYVELSKFTQVGYDYYMELKNFTKIN